MDNGTDKISIGRLDMAEGWACFLAAEPPPKSEDLRPYLSKSTAAWLKQNPMLSVRATLPIVSADNTIAIPVWFD